MGRARMTIVGSMGVIALMALGLAAIHNPTRLAANGIFSLILVALFGASIMGLVRRGRGRAFCLGFAVAGWGYLILSLGPWFEETTGPYLVTTPLIDLAYAKSDTRPNRVLWINRGSDREGGSQVVNVAAEPFWNDTQLDQVNHLGGNRYGFVPSAPYPLYRIGHTLFALLAGLAGGLTGWLAAGRRTSP
jgi:hypothetical protein